MKRTASLLVVSLLALGSGASGSARAEIVRRALCTQANAVREVELRSVTGASDVCDIVERRAGEGSEERTLYPAAAGSSFCAARFEGVVRSLDDAGWRCSVEARASERPAPSRSAPAAPRDIGASAREWRSACITAHVETRSDAETLCHCAVEVLGEAGFEEGDFEVLASPYTADVERPAHRAGLLYGVGMMAVDALARCGAP